MADKRETKPANRMEMDTFYRLAAATYTLKSYHEDLKARTKMIPGGWRDLRACVALMDNLVHKIMPTFDEKKRTHIERQMRNMRMRVVFGPEASREPDSIIVTTDDLAVLLCAAGESCKLRMCKPGECNACQLGKVLDRCSFVTRENRAWWEVIAEAGKEQESDTKKQHDMANTIKKLRIKAGLTQQELAEKVGISQGTVAGWECGNSKPGVKVIPKLSEVFNVPLDVLTDLMME